MKYSSYFEQSQLNLTDLSSTKLQHQASLTLFKLAGLMSPRYQICPRLKYGYQSHFVVAIFEW